MSLIDSFGNPGNSLTRNLRRKASAQMRVFYIRIFTLLLLLLLPATPLIAGSEEFITLSELKPDMRGKAYSVFRGTEPESFAVEFHGEVDGPVAGNRYMMLRVVDDSLRIGPGFSGSPVYFDGRLAGAISHAEKNMTTQYVMAVPISRMFEDESCSVKIPDEKPYKGKPVKPGSMISIPFVRGDFTMGAAGTVTYVKDNLLLAFGHENLFSANSVEFPIHLASVIAVIPKVDLTHKEASTLEEIGSVVWDGKSAIVGRLGGKAPMSPLIVEFISASGRSRIYRLEMLNFTKLAPTIITRVVRHLASSNTPNRTGGTDIDLTLSVTIKPLESPVVINQRINADILKSESNSASNPVDSLMSALLMPLKETGAISSISVKMAELTEARVGTIVETAFARTRARAGETVNLLVRMSGPFGEAKEIRIPVTIPEGYEEPIFTVSVHPGTSVRPSENPPASVQDIADWLSGIARSDDLVILYPATIKNRHYPHSRITRAMARSPWNLTGSGEASIKVIKHD